MRRYHYVGMALSPNEGLKPEGNQAHGEVAGVGMALSPNEGLKLAPVRWHAAIIQGRNGAKPE